MTTGFTTEQIVGKVAALLARAEHPNTPPPEAEACRLKAEAMMLQYRIDAAQINAQAAPTAKALPEWRTMPIRPAGGEFHMNYWSIFSACVAHLDVRAIMRTDYIVDEQTGERVLWYVAEAVGYAVDLDFAMMLATEFMLAFSKRLEPKYDPTLSEQVNAYLMRSAGMEGKRIAMAIYGRDDKHLRPKVRKMFADEAAARGEDPKALTGQGNNMKTYRRSYAEGFVNTVWNRLYMMAASRKGTGELVLASRKKDVDEAFYTKYPRYRPAPAKAAIGDGYETCEKCKRAKGGVCRTHQWRKVKEKPLNVRAYRRGASAAQEVNLGGTKEVGQ